MTVVLDSSAVLAYLWSEPDSDRIGEFIREGMISSVNVVEVLSKLIDHGMAGEAANLMFAGLNLSAIAFDADQARLAGDLRSPTRRYGLSLGDRACLALAIREKAQVITADRIWAELDLGIEIEVIR
ncbi:MAG TPA: type II toxin-antitoxin system VapC family toxin [Aurantimonas sp.]|uniref:Type II toxin-antitoxin system VapC family toxin n=1 Tax=Aurantimonas marianensis TaxID=2920428 RepID=A0A9X2HE75_9HYPH|nr:type II toxin-antitoxin system VapC family toxin [Aurantimonas marianensis]